MKPDDYCDSIEEYLDDALSREDREEMERHLPVCVSCRTAVEDYKRLRRLALAVPPVEIPDDLGFHIRRRLEREPLRWKPARRILYPFAWGGVAAAAALILVATLFIPEDGPPAPDPVDPVVTTVAAAPTLEEVVADWLVMASNSGPADADRLAAEAREHRLLERVRDLLDEVRGEERRYWIAVSDLLVQLGNGPGFLAEEARLVAMVRQS